MFEDFPQEMYLEESLRRVASDGDLHQVEELVKNGAVLNYGDWVVIY